MFETCHFLCQQLRGISDYEWVYSAGNGSIRMGNFSRILCSLASFMASTYRLGKLLRHLNCISKNNKTLVGWASRPPLICNLNARQLKPERTSIAKDTE